MSTNSQDQEIDLGQIGKGVKKMGQNFINSIFDLIFFFQKRIVIFSILFITGVALAFLLDNKTYNHEISVIPNFGSNDYVYKKIEQLDTKLREKDQDFFKKIGLKNFKSINSVKIEAFPAIYNFVNTRDQQNNFELIKLMAEDGDIDKIMKDEITSINYYHHKISIQTKGMLKKEEFIIPILNYLNDNEYYQKQKKIHFANLKEKIAVNDSLIKQIDKLIFQLSTNNSSTMVSVSEKNSIPELIEKKDRLIGEIQLLRTNENIYDSVVKEESSILNIRNYKPLFLNNKIVFPIVLILLYAIIITLVSTYKKQKARLHS